MFNMSKEYLEEHLRSRGMNPRLYNISYCPEESIITFPLYNGSGSFVGYQSYRPLSYDKKNNDPRRSRYFTYLPDRTDGMFGLESLRANITNIYIVEGIFKAATLHRLGFSSIAVLSNNPKRMKPYFRILRAKYNLIAIGDNDPAGKMLVNCVGKGFLSPIDLDEMEDQDIIKLLDAGIAQR